MDALTHAIEAYIGLIGTPKTNKWAIETEGNPTYPVPKLLWAEDFEKLLHNLKGK